MKKKIVGAAIIAAIAVTAGWNFNQRNNEVKLSDLMLANIEALADTENRDLNCDKSSGSECVFLVVSPSGYWSETHWDYKNKD